VLDAVLDALCQSGGGGGRGVDGATSTCSAASRSGAVNPTPVRSVPRVVLARMCSMSATEPAPRDAFGSLGWTCLDVGPGSPLRAGSSQQEAVSRKRSAGSSRQEVGWQAGSPVQRRRRSRALRGSGSAHASWDHVPYAELIAAVLPLVTEELARLAVMFVCEAPVACRWWYWPWRVAPERPLCVG
jgi:hypothetical protein